MCEIEMLINFESFCPLKRSTHQRLQTICEEGRGKAAPYIFLLKKAKVRQK